MKKFLSAVTALVIMLSSSIQGSVTAVGKINPYLSPDRNLICEGCGATYSQSLSNLSDLFDKDYGSLANSDYLGQKVSFFPSGNEANANSGDICRSLGVITGVPNSVPININGAAGKTNSAYQMVLCFKVSQEKMLKSFTFAVPGKNTPWGDCAVDGFSVFVGNSDWRECKNYKTPLESESDKVFDKVAEVSGLISSGKYIDSQNGEFRYFEAGFDTPVNTEYVILAFSSNNISPVLNAYNSGKLPRLMLAFTEFAVFDKSISGEFPRDDYRIVPPVEKLFYVKLEVGDMIIERGKEFTVLLSVWRADPFSSIELIPDFPDVFTLISIDDTPYNEYDMKRVGQYKWEADHNIFWSTGIAYLTFVSSVDAVPGDYEIGFKAKSCKNIDGVDLPVIFDTGKIKLNDFSFGDVNLDGAIDCVDLISLKKYIDGKSAKISEAADVNADGATDLSDFKLLTEYLADLDTKTGSSDIHLGPSMEY